MAGCGGMWAGGLQGVGACGRGWVFGRGVRPMAWTGTCGGGGGMW